MGIGSLAKVAAKAIRTGRLGRAAKNEVMDPLKKQIRDATTPRTDGQERISQAARGTRAVREGAMRGVQLGSAATSAASIAADALVKKGKSPKASAAKGRAAAASMGKVKDSEARMAAMKRKETTIRNKNLAAKTPATASASKPPASNGSKAFNAAFAKARSAGNKTFTFNGDKYTTAKKGK